MLRAIDKRKYFVETVNSIFQSTGFSIQFAGFIALDFFFSGSMD